jgi:DNA integrity scanning protein DisA with diadenylate cyclase activity
MANIVVVQTIGDLLTGIDTILAGPSLDQSSPEWQQLFALRKHLDDQQKELVKAMFDEDTAAFTQLTQRLQGVDSDMQKVIDDVNNVSKIIGYVSKAASVVDQLLSVAK